MGQILSRLKRASGGYMQVDRGRAGTECKPCTVGKAAAQGMGSPEGAAVDFGTAKIAKSTKNGIEDVSPTFVSLVLFAVHFSLFSNRPENACLASRS
jgi:hypothetical protein